MGNVIRMPGMNKDDQKTTAVEIPKDIRDILASIESISDDEYERVIEVANGAANTPARRTASIRLAKYTLGWYHGWFENAAIDGLVEAQYLLARLIETGLIDEHVWEGRAPEGEPDWLAAAYWFDQADRQGYARASGRAQALYQRVLQQAEATNADDMFDIAACHETGLFSFLPQDIDEALLWYQRAVEAGSTPACRALADIHFFGAYGKPRSLEHAIPALRKRFADAVSGLVDFRNKHHRDGFELAVSAMGGSSPLTPLLLACFETHDATLDQQLFEWEQSLAGDIEDDEEPGPGCSWSSDWQMYLLRACVASAAHRSIDLVRKLLGFAMFADGTLEGVLGSRDYEDYGTCLDLRLTSKHQTTATWGWPFGRFEGRTATAQEVIHCRRVEATLRELAQRGFIEAILLLGLILIGSSEKGSLEREEGKLWLEKGVREGDLLSCLWYAAYARHDFVCAKSEAIKDALRRVIYANHDDEEALRDRLKLRKRGYNSGGGFFVEDFFGELQRRAEVELDNIEKEEVARQARLDAQKEMLSFLSHTLTNSVAGTTETLLRIARSMGKAHTNPRLPTPAERLIGLVANFSLTERLVESFKLYASDPEALRRTWESEDTGELPLSRVVALAIRQALVRFLFHTEHAVDVGRLLPDADDKAFLREFIDRALAFDLDRDDEVAALLDWVAEKLPFLAIQCHGIDTLRCARNGARYVVVFSLVSELLGNALKYASRSGTITLTLTATDAGFEIVCSNPSDAASTTAIRGGRKGMSFMRTICELVGARLELPDGSETEYRVRAVLPIQ